MLSRWKSLVLLPPEDALHQPPPSALPLTSLGLDSGAGCCTVWNLTSGAGKHVTLSWLDTSAMVLKTYALAWILTFYLVVYIVHVWPRRNTFTRILRFSWASRSRSTRGNPPLSGEFAFWMKHTIPFMYLFLMSQQIVHTEMGIYKSAGQKMGWEENTLPFATLTHSLTTRLAEGTCEWLLEGACAGLETLSPDSPLETTGKYTVKEKRR